MKFASTALGAAAVAVAAVLTVAAPHAGAATGTPPYEPDPSSVGTISFYNASGTVISSGSISTKPFAAYAVGSAVVHAGDTAAVMAAAQPNPSALTGNWNVDTLNGFTPYPITSGPANIQTLSQTHPVSTGSSSDLSISDFIAEFPNTDPSGIGCAYSATPSGCTNTAYQNLYQIRLKTANGPTQTSTYDVADLLIDPATGTWTQVYPTPAPPTKTTTATTLSASPSPATVGDTVTLTAAVSPAKAGTVQFKDGTTNLGSPVAVNTTTGLASMTTSSLTVGSHALSAVFTPTDTTNFTGSTGTATEQVNPLPATPTSTSLAVSPISTAAFGATVTLTASLTPSNAVGSVEFKDGGSNLGSPVAVSSGSATFNTSSLSSGSHSLTAVFLPTDATQFGTSGSAATSYTVQAQPTTTTLALDKTGPVQVGTALKLTATLAPSSATGTVQFKDGTTPVGAPVAVTTGKATLTTSALTVGTHSLTAEFTPTNGALFGPSVSAAANIQITLPPPTTTVTTLTTTPATRAVVGSAVTLKAVVAPSTAGGTVQFLDGTTPLGTPVTVSGGTATFSASSLALGAHSLSAQFNATDSTLFHDSNSTAVPLQIIPPPTVTTTTLTADVTGAQTGQNVKLTATLDPSAATGTVQFTDGTAKLGAPVTLSGSGASATVSFTTTGPHALSAVFTPADALAYTSSTGTLSITVQPVPTAATDNVAAKDADGNDVAPGSTLKTGDTLNLTVTGLGDGQAIDVTLHSAPTDLGTATANGSGTLLYTFTVPARLLAGDHVIVFADQAGTALGAFTFTIAPASTPTPTSAGSSSPAGGTAASSHPAGFGGALADTGARVGGLVGLAVALLAAGSVSLASSRRRLWIRGRHH